MNVFSRLFPFVLVGKPFVTTCELRRTLDRKIAVHDPAWQTKGVRRTYEGLAKMQQKQQAWASAQADAEARVKARLKERT